MGSAINSQRLAEGYAEFIFFQPGRYIRLCSGVDIRIHPDAYRRLPAHLPGHVVQSFEFACRFDVETHDPGSERLAHVVTAFAHAGEDGLCRIAAGRDHPREFAAGNDVESAAHARKKVEDGQIRIGFHRVTDQVPTLPEWLVITAQGLLERSA